MRELLVVFTAVALTLSLSRCVEFRGRHSRHPAPPHHHSRHPHGGPPGQTKHGGRGPSTGVEIELRNAEVEIHT